MQHNISTKKCFFAEPVEEDAALKFYHFSNRVFFLPSNKVGLEAASLAKYMHHVSKIYVYNIADIAFGCIAAYAALFVVA